MPITVAELQTVLLAESSQFDAKLDQASRRLATFGSTKHPDAKLGLNTSDAEARLQKIIADFRKAKREMESGVRINVSGAGLGAGSRINSSNLMAQGQAGLQAGMIVSAAFTKPLVAGGLLVTNLGMKFEDAWTGVTRKVDGTDRQLKKLQATLRDMATGVGQKAIPVDVEELAAIAASAGQLGIKVPAIADFTRAMAAMGVTTNMTSEQAASSLAQFANIIQMSQKDFDRLASTVLYLGKNSAATESQIVQMGLRLSGAANMIGLTAAETMSFATALASVGIRAEAGGSAFGQVLINVSKAVREGGKELDIFAKVAGVSASRFKLAFQKDAAAAIVTLVEGFGRMRAAGGNVFSTLEALHMNERRVRDAIFRAAGAGDLFAKTLEMGNKAWRENTALVSESERRYSTTSNQLKIFQNQLKEQGIEISEKLLPALNRLIQKYGQDLPKAIGMTADAFGALPEQGQKAIFGAVALLALVGPAKIATANIRLLQAALQSTWAAAAANPALAVGVVLALAAGYAVLSKTLSNIAEAEAEAKQNTNDLAGGFKRMLAVLPNGKHAAEIEKLRAQISEAGTDLGKLERAGQSLSKTKARLNLEIKNPDLALVMSDELNRAQNALDRQKLTATVLVRPIYEQAVRSITDTAGITNRAKPIWDNQTVDGGGDTGMINRWVDSWMGYNATDGTTPGATIDPRFRDVGSQQFGGKNETDVAKALREGHENTMRLKAAANEAKAKAAFQKFAAQNGLTGAGADYANSSAFGFGVNLPQITGKTATGEQTYVTPGSVAVDATPAGVAAARARLLKAKGSPTTMPKSTAGTGGTPYGGVPTTDEDDEKARKAAEKERARQEAAARHREALLSAWRSKQAQAAEQSARPWEKLNETLGEMGLRLVGFDAKTEGARARARMLNKEFSQLPKGIQDATVQMATLLDQMDEMGKQRDGLRDSNAGTVASLLRSGAGVSPFLAAIRGQESAYNFGGRIDAARTRAAWIGGQLGPMSASEASSRNEQARKLREQNDEIRFNDLGGSGGAPFKGVVTGDAVVQAAKAAEAAAQPKFRQTCAWAVTQMYRSFGVEIESQNKNVAANWVKYARAHWRQVDAATAPPGALLAEPSDKANSGWHVAMSRGGRYRAGSNVHKLQLGSAGRNALAFIPPQLDPERAGDRSTASASEMPASTAAPAPAKKPVKAPSAPSLKIGASNLESPLRDKPGTGALLPYTEKELKDLLRAWGPIVTEGSERPGMSNSARLSKQDELLTRLANGERLSPARVAADRQAANVADMLSSRAKATTDMKRAQDELGRSTVNQVKTLADARRAFDESGGSMAAYERQTFQTQKRIEAYSSEEVVALWNQKRFHEANKLAAQQVAGAMTVYDKEKGNGDAMSASRAATALADETAMLNEQRDYLAQNAGKPEAAISRGMDEISRKWTEYRRLVNEEAMDPKVAAVLAAQTAAQQSANAATREAVDLQRQLNAENAQRDEDETANNDQNRLRGNGLNSRQRAREMAGLAAERAKSRELADAVNSGNMPPEFADLLAWQAGQDARTRFDREAGGKRDDDAEAMRKAHDARMAGLAGQRGLHDRFGANPQELQVQLRLLERKNELEAENAQLDDSEKINIGERLTQYEQEVRAEEQINRLTERRAAIQNAVENTLSLQKEHELMMARTAAERLAIEQKYDAQARARRGETVSDEERAEQAKQRDQATQNEQLSNAQSQAGRVRDLIASTMKDGAKKGMAGMLDMIQQAAFERIAGKLTNALFGEDILGQGGDILDVLNGKKGKKGAASAPASGEPSLIPSVLDGLHKHRKAKTADGIDTNPLSVKRGGAGGLLGGLLGGGADGGAIQNATIHIQNATEHVQYATIYSRGGASDGNGSGSGSSLEQTIGRFGGLFGG